MHFHVCRLRHKELSQSELRELDFKVSRGSQDARDDSRAENAIEVGNILVDEPMPCVFPKTVCHASTPFSPLMLDCWLAGLCGQV